MEKKTIKPILVSILTLVFVATIIYLFLTSPNIPGEVYSSMIIVLICVILFFIVFIKARNTDPLKKPKGIMLVAEIAVNIIESMVVENMGERFRSFSGYMFAVVAYVFMCFTIGLLGLPSPMTYYMVPLSIALCTFVLIHYTSMKHTKWGYFKRFLDPLPVFLPVNLLSMWAPLISLSFRLFGNAISGWVLMTIAYEALKGLSNAITGLPFFASPFVAPLLHAYFDIFSGYIQTLVFSTLTMMFIMQEVPEADSTLDVVEDK